MTSDYTPARLRELADNAFDTEFRDLQAALRAAADTIEIERETNGATALLLQQARATLAAREALLKRAGEALRPLEMTAVLIDDLRSDAKRYPAANDDAVSIGRWIEWAVTGHEQFIADTKIDVGTLRRARALAAEIAAALKETDQ